MQDFKKIFGEEPNDKSWDTYWDLKSSMKTHFKEGEAKGKKEAKITIAKKLMAQNVDIEIVHI